MIDLRSDTVTRPTPEMRTAMAHADVGDDVYGDDPTVNLLEAKVAELLGMEAAVFLPSGSMSNQIAVRIHAGGGDRILLHEGSHILKSEGGGAAALSGVTCQALAGTRGLFTAKDVEAALPHSHRFTPVHLGSPAKALCIENTHAAGGGSIWPMEQLRSVANAARERGLALHLDGARLWHAAVATNTSMAVLVAPFDTVSVCFSKGLGAPIGSALLGSAEAMALGRRYKQLLGGGLRQAGIVAAGALYALEHNQARLAEDHQKARSFAEGISALSGVDIDPTSVETNIVWFSLVGVDPASFVERCHSRGLYVLTAGATGVRAVFHMDIHAEDVATAIAVVSAALD